MSLFGSSQSLEVVSNLQTSSRIGNDSMVRPKAFDDLIINSDAVPSCLGNKVRILQTRLPVSREPCCQVSSENELITVLQFL